MSETKELTKTNQKVEGMTNKHQQIIVTSKSRLEKAQKIAKALISKEMTEDHKKTCLTFVGNTKRAVEELRESRMPFTRELNKIIQQFTALENEMKKLGLAVRKEVDVFTAKQVKKQREEEAAIRATAERKRKNLEAYDNYLKEFKAAIDKGVGSMTLENFNDKVSRFKAAKYILPKDRFSQDFYPELSERFREDVETHREDVLESLVAYHFWLKKGNNPDPSKVTRFLTKTDIEKEINETKVEEIKQLMDVEDAPNVNISFTVTITKNEGMLDLMKFWYTNEGHKIPLDKVGTMSISRMLKYAEKMAKKKVFIESEYLSYQENIKAA